MRVAIDARGVQPKLQGIGRHVLNLLLGLSYMESELEFIVFYNNPLARKLVERSGGPYRGRFQWVKSLAQPDALLERAELPWLLRINNVSLFHDVGMTGAWGGGMPSVVTVHELSAAAAAKGAEGNPPARARRMLRNARLIISVSQSLADEIESVFSISRPKIRVVLNAVDPWYAAPATEKEIRAMRERFRLPGRYFLCVTADRPTKNVDLVRRVAAAWKGKGQGEWVFTVPGKDAGDLRYLDVVEDVWLRPLYTACAALVCPSSYEGFSLPPIEALSVGALPVVSDIAPHRETLGEILPPQLFFDPGDPSSLERSLRAVLDGGEPMRVSVLEKFRAVRDRYSFRATAEQIQAVYREALRG